MTYWIDVSKALIGTAVGSGLGLGSALLVWRIQQRRMDLAAGNVAVVILGQYFFALQLVGKAIREEQQEVLEVAPGAAPWMTVRAMHVAFKRDLSIDLKQLAFLSDKPTLLERLAFAERLYFDLIETIDEYNDVHRQIQQATADAGFKSDQLVTVGEIENAIGGHRAAQANKLLASILQHVEDDEKEFRGIASELSTELRKRLGRSLVLRREQKVAEFKASPTSAPSNSGG